MSITLKLDGFDQLYKALEKAGKNADAEAVKCAQKCADIFDAELRNQIIKTANVKSEYTYNDGDNAVTVKNDRESTQMNLAHRMPKPRIKNSFGFVRAEVGFEKGNYDPSNISDGYKAIFLNYGTPKRKAHGQLEPRNFRKKAERVAKPKMQKVVEDTKTELLKELEL